MRDTRFKLGVVMDELSTIQPYKDSTVALLLEAQRRDYELYCMQTQDLLLHGEMACGWMRKLRVKDDQQAWYEQGAPVEMPLTALDLVLMRKDPPIDRAFSQALTILACATRQGVKVANHPQALHTFHEKITALRFKNDVPPSIVTAHYEALNAFLDQQRDIILKPLDYMGGHGVMRVQQGDSNFKTMWELLTHRGKYAIMAQRFIPAIGQGDKRILLIHGKPVPYALVRVPPKGEIRANLAVGGQGHTAPLSSNDQAICARVMKALSGCGLSLIGLDVIGDYLTEVNITSPTGIRQIERAHNLSICQSFFDGFSLS